MLLTCHMAFGDTCHQPLIQDSCRVHLRQGKGFLWMSRNFSYGFLRAVSMGLAFCRLSHGRNVALSQSSCRVNLLQEKTDGTSGLVMILRDFRLNS